MSKKLFTYISIIIAAVQSVAIGSVNYFECAHATAINEAITVAGSAAITICGLFTVNEEIKKYKALLAAKKKK